MVDFTRWIIVMACLLALGGSTVAVAADPPAQHWDWRWVHGAVYVPTNCVNEAQMWDEYDPAVIDRELHCASIYGINCLRVFLHYDIYLKKKDALLSHIEDFLTRADKYGLKTEFVFFDDCWNQPPADILQADYKYPSPIFGVHNSRWLVSPGANVQAHYDEHKDRLKAYVQDIVNAHKADPRIVYWETYNEPNKSAETTRLGTDALAWIKETGSTIPVTATGTDSAGDPYSEFKSWHTYDPTDRLAIKGDPIKALCTECMNRRGESVPAIVNAFKGKTGFIIWEYGIGRDNCRFAWDQNGGHPAVDENAAPFHGMVYPDGHPWSVDDVKALLGPDAFAKTPLFAVDYFKDDHFSELAKRSVTPFIDFDRLDERGVGSPDSSVNIPKDHYSVRWTGSFIPPATATYNFYADGDNIVRLTVGGSTIIDKKDPQRKEVAGQLPLNRGVSCSVMVEYVHATGDSSLHVTYKCMNLMRQVLMSSATAPVADGPTGFAKGVDLSVLKTCEAHGVTYKMDGKVEDPIAIFKANGCNYVRLRLFVNPPGTEGQVNTLAYDLALAKRVKQAGLSFYLDFHYSDIWADAGHQVIPAAWKNLPHDQLVRKIHDYTLETLKQFADAGCPPDMVSIGNEITNGMMWPAGGPLDHADRWPVLIDLLSAAAKAVREAGNAKVMIHLDKGGNTAVSEWFFSHCQKANLDFDVIGLSYYPFWHGTLDDLQKNLTALATKYQKDIYVVETSYDVSGKQGNLPYPLSPEGQKQFLEKLMTVVAATPGGHGKGVFWWEPAWIDDSKWNGVRGYGVWENRAMFDNNGNARPVISAFEFEPTASAK